MIGVGVPDKLYLRWRAKGLPSRLRSALRLSDDTGPLGFMTRLLDELQGEFRLLPGSLLRGGVYLTYHPMSTRALGDVHQAGNGLLTRVDGLFERSSVHGMEGNRRIRATLRASDMVVYQSEFARRIISEAFGEIQTPYRVILNGAHPIPRSPDRPGRKLLLVVSRYRPHKRVDQLVEVFLTYPRVREFDLVVIGDVPMAERRTHERVRYLGSVGRDVVRSALARAAALLHPAWFDWCPNAVVEALVADVPVVCTNRGGTKELVRDSGLVLENDPEEVHWPLDWRGEIPRLDPDLLHRALDDLLEGSRQFRFPRRDLHMGGAAARYASALRDAAGVR